MDGGMNFFLLHILRSVCIRNDFESQILRQLARLDSLIMALDGTRQIGVVPQSKTSSLSNSTVAIMPSG